MHKVGRVLLTIKHAKKYLKYIVPVFGKYGEESKMYFHYKIVYFLTFSRSIVTIY